MAETTQPMLVLVTGATGYIGGRLVPRLLQAGYRVRCFVRDPERLQGRPWLDQVEVVAGDVLQAETLTAAMVGIRAAYYLIHSMAGGQGFHERDLVAARNFGAAAAAAGVGRILYMGGLGDHETLTPDTRLSVPSPPAVAGMRLLTEPERRRLLEPSAEWRRRRLEAMDR